MVEEEEIFSSKVKYNGIFSFKDFYKFCHSWLTDEKGLYVSEEAYKEKIAGDAKEIEVKWSATKKITDYFKFKIKIVYDIKELRNIEIVQDGVKVKTNQGAVEIKIKGVLMRDYEGKFEQTAWQKFMRSVYEKFIITSRIRQYEDKLIEWCDGFLGQAKAYLDLEGRK
jgi:hypothetical protein